MFSGLQLGDSWLTCTDLLTMDLSGALVVMSSCGSGEVGHGTAEPVGLAWAALAAGARGVLVSQWVLDDAAALDLMTGIYRRLRKGAAAPSALRAAQLEVARTRPHPYHWAPMTFIAPPRSQPALYRAITKESVLTTLTRQVTLAATALLAGLLTVTPVAAADAVEETAQPAQFIVKIGRDDCSVEGLAAKYGFTVDDEVLSTKRLYRAHPNTVAPATHKDVEKIVGRLRGDHCVAYVESGRPDPDRRPEQFHSWTPDAARGQLFAGVGVPERPGRPEPGCGARAPAREPTSPSRCSTRAWTPPTRCWPGGWSAGYDYVDDDDDPDDATYGTDTDGDGIPDEGAGHGTFVSGLVTMIAPDARVMPMRVLDSDGIGTVFSVAEAVYDATDAGAQVINLSLGTPEKLDSEVLKKALEWAHKRQVVVVAAAGNDGWKQKQYPAASPDVLAVTATTADDSGCGDLLEHRRLGRCGGRRGRLWSVRFPSGSYGRWSGTSLSTAGSRGPDRAAAVPTARRQERQAPRGGVPHLPRSWRRRI